MNQHHLDDSHDGRKLFYVSVQAGQILEDREAAAYELEIYANEEDVSRLRELFEELSSMEEAEAFHFVSTPYKSNSDDALSGASDDLIGQVYRLIYNCGTVATKRHIESMGLF